VSLARVEFWISTPFPFRLTSANGTTTPVLRLPRPVCKFLVWSDCSRQSKLCGHKLKYMQPRELIYIFHRRGARPHICHFCCPTFSKLLDRASSLACPRFLSTLVVGKITPAVKFSATPSHLMSDGAAISSLLSQPSLVL
jgi:hypothetical protein